DGELVEGADDGRHLLEQHLGFGIERHGLLQSGRAAEYRQGEALVNALEGHLDGEPDAEPARRPVVQEGREAEARVLLQLDERGDEGHAVLVAGEERPVHGHPREEPPAPADPRPLVAPAAALRAGRGRVPDPAPAVAAARDAELARAAALPERARHRPVRVGQVALRDLARRRHQPRPRSRVACSEPEKPATSPTSASFTWRGPAAPRSCRTDSHRLFIESMTACASWPPLGFTGSAPPSAMRPPATNGPPSPRPQNPMSSSCWITIDVKLS